MTALLDDTRRTALRAFCDTIVPSIPRENDPDGFWARKATDLGIDQHVEGLIAQITDEGIRGGLLELIDVFGSQGLERQPSQLSREQILHNIRLVSAEAAAGIQSLAQIVLFLYYGAPDPQSGQNPNWATFGYPGPVSPAPEVPKAIETLTPEGDTVLEADVCVVGSGSGGGVIAATLAQRGLKVVVLEAAGYFNESDFAQLEMKAYQEMYWRGGPTPSADGNISLQAGTTLGGGTTINWTNCLRTPDWVRRQWADEHGLEGVDGPDFDRHLDAVLTRIGATDKASDFNGPQQRMAEACERLGWSMHKTFRNADLEKYSPDTAGYIGFGDQSGSKLSGEKTWLRDAAEHGAEFVVRCSARKVLTENGAAAGVEAVYTGEDGSTANVTVRAPKVVVAAGALESPALLLRSGIGGPATGDYLRLHPCTAVLGVYGSDQQSWWGAPHAAVVDEFADTGDGYGFLIEGAQYTTAIGASAVPWTSGEAHKTVLEGFANGASFIALTRDHGHGRVVLDPRGESAPFYDVTDEIDQRNLLAGVEQIVRMHDAAGARQIFVLAGGMPVWRPGDDLDAFVEQVKKIPLRAGGYKLFSAHQMGTCRMGTDPDTSVANPWGELHDVKGVFIGDGSAFPTPSGVNPMVSIMALAHRTAEAMAGTAARDPEAVAAN